MFSRRSSKSKSPKRESNYRAKHLSSFLNDPTLKPSTRRVGEGDSTYDTVFQTKHANALIVRTYFPSSDTIVAPKMLLIGIRATHPWLDHSLRVVGYSPILSTMAWESSGILLGQAVNAVVQHFQLNPPEVIEIIDANLREIQNRINPANNVPSQSQTGNGYHNSPNIPSHNRTASTYPTMHDHIHMEQQSDLPPHFNTILEFNYSDATVHEAMLANVHIPSAPTSFPELNDMNLPELNELLQREDKFASTLEKIPYVTTIKATHESLSTETAKIAKSNLELEEELKTLRGDVEGLQESLKEKVDKYVKLQKKQTELCKPTDKRKAMSQLNSAKRDAFNESEEVASNWIANEIGIDDFLDSFIEKRAVHHVRAAKIERLQDS